MFDTFKQFVRDRKRKKQFDRWFDGVPIVNFFGRPNSKPPFEFDFCADTRRDLRSFPVQLCASYGAGKNHKQLGLHLVGGSVTVDNLEANFEKLIKELRKVEAEYLAA